MSWRFFSTRSFLCRFIQELGTFKMLLAHPVCLKRSLHLLAKCLFVYVRLREPEPPSRGAFPLFGSRFRYSGRTQYQTRNAASTISRQAPSIDRSSRRAPRGPGGTLEGSRSGTLDRPSSRGGTLDRGAYNCILLVICQIFLS